MKIKYMPIQNPTSENMKPQPPKPEHPKIPKEVIDKIDKLAEKVARLEGMVEVLIRIKS